VVVGFVARGDFAVTRALPPFDASAQPVEIANEIRFEPEPGAGVAPEPAFCESDRGEAARAPDAALSRYFAADPTEVRLSVSAIVRSRPGAREILLMRRSDNGHWGLPGGYLEPGESVTQATLREVREETGWSVDVGRLVGVYSDPSRQVIEYPDRRRVQAINLCFEALAREAGPVGTPGEVTGIGFYAVDALPEPFVPIHAIRIEDCFAGDAAARVR